MSQRTWAGVLAVPLLIGLWAAVVLTPLPYVTYEPGITVDVLGEEDGREIVQVEGEQTYRDDGELRLTTVYVSRPQADVNLFEVVEAWFDDDAAVLPYDAVYAPDTTPEESERRGAAQMVSSQDTAIALALRELGHEVSEVVEVVEVSDTLPAAGRLEVRDVLLEVADREVSSPQDVVAAVDDARPGEPLEFVVERDGQRRTVEVTPAEVDGDLRVGITPAPGYAFPFDVSVRVDPAIGGPSAGLLFALSVYDTLTPGSLTGGEVVAGTGTLDPEGAVGPIGGIAQKIAAARETGAALFLVPPDNCEEAAGAAAGDMRLVRAESLRSTLDAISAWVEDPDADLPTCERSAE
ncbi:PDZ domain-containing protein [Nocardioides solisilvae]|uniref:YlbL family protein n=1 Tax=Nocardioides solisilvae TaxID=1542435 RepID=UPI000D746FA1|nr:PDZ domain-containing protein [Nocardioides solisilvae]